jgi:RNA polymerase sigma factor (sigma-70 family)
MPELDDHDLLADFARSGSEAAFAALVARHVNLVYSAALRFTGNPHHAEEITQAVFINLARKAGALSSRIVLSGWLYQTARLTAANFVKGEVRRERREQEAYMQSTLTEPDLAVWEQIAPLLDQAMGRLGETGRNAIVLRFFENKTAQEVGTALKLNEAAAHKRVSRALDKLRKVFTKHGATLSATLIAGAVAANSVQAAPVGLAAKVTATALKGSAVSATITRRVKGTLKLMNYAKLKLAVGITAGILLAGGAATVVLSSDESGAALSPGEIFKRAQENYASMKSYSDEGKTIATLNGTTITTTFAIKLARPDLYRVEWTQATAYFTNSGTVWSAGNGDFMAQNYGQYNAKPVKYQDMQSTLATATGISASATATIPGTFFKMNWGDQLGGSTAGEKRQADQTVGNVDCYVFRNDLKGRTKTIWIGKQDFLIHQVRIVTSAADLKAMMTEEAKRHPQIAAQLSKTEYTEDISTETHENISVNQKFSPADFVR